jgi:hypothetical protein
MKDAVSTDRGPLKSLSIELEMEMESPMLHSNSLYYTNCAKTCAIMTVGGAGAARRDKDLRSPLTRGFGVYITEVSDG